MTDVAFYKEGVPYDDKGQVIITLLNGNPDESGSGGGGGTGGNKSESSAAIHATAKWSTAQLKKTQAEQAARAKAAAEAQAKAKANRDALTQRLKDIVNEALRHNASRMPSATELAHANNAAMQAEAERLRLAKAEEKARKEAEAAEKAFQEAEQRRKEIEREMAETERLMALSEEVRAVEIAEKVLSAAKAELVNAEKDVQSKRVVVSRVSEELKNAQKSVDVKVTGFPGWRNVQKKLEKQLQAKKNEYISAENALNASIKDKNLKASYVQSAELKLKEAKDALINSQIKNAVDATVSFYQNLSEKYGEKYSKMAQELADKSKGKKIGNVNEALAAFEKYKDVLNKKFSKADRDAIFNALASVKYEDWAKHLDQFAKYLKITGHVSFGYDVVSDILKIKDTGDWKPLFLTLEKKAADAGVSYIVALLFSLLAGTTLGIWGIAIITGILCSYIDKNKLNTINEVLGI
ncbi:TPA: colicin-10 [Escherichia coli]|uniref:colicin-like pore-forming protein n=1 Tax=Escherichia coli TaxID=562 RepID=UPI001A0952C3|nr:colicin-like pore-forming protein [Escherichia coli]HAP0130309.1 colicin-10 [Escherichia coli]HAP0135586.1 colicin-10 [Escherichia coli]HAP0165407.1 colicin-10 [Escherichia coli]HAP0219916.1 colicin-10 [Escherichia coli]HAP0240188.1 colicin-10 [Escherichia coli]